MITFLPHSPFTEKFEREWSPIPLYSLYRYLSGPAFLAPNTQSPIVNFVCKFFDRVSDSKTNKFTTVLWVKVALSCFKQVSLNFTANFALWIHCNLGARLLTGLVGNLMISSDNPSELRAIFVNLLNTGVVKHPVVSGILF